MKKIVFLLVLAVSALAVNAKGRGSIRKETRFLSDKMAYELNLSDYQYNDVYEINYDFVASIQDLMPYVMRGDGWALEEYYEALDIRNDDLRWVLSDYQYRRFLRLDYFYRPVHVCGGHWGLRVYLHYPNRLHFYFGVPTHYHTYCGAHYRPHIHHVSYYRNRHDCHHYNKVCRIRAERQYHSYRRSDFGSITFRSNSYTRPSHVRVRTRIVDRDRDDDDDDDDDDRYRKHGNRYDRSHRYDRIHRNDRDDDDDDDDDDDGRRRPHAVTRPHTLPLREASQTTNGFRWERGESARRNAGVSQAAARPSARPTTTTTRAEHRSPARSVERSATRTINRNVNRAPERRSHQRGESSTRDSERGRDSRR